MICPRCKNGTGIKDTRHDPIEEVTRRVHFCKECRHQFRTVEIHLSDYSRLKKLDYRIFNLKRTMEQFRSILDTV